MTADKVYEELKGRVKDAVLRMIQAERGGEAIDRPLLRWGEGSRGAGRGEEFGRFCRRKTQILFLFFTFFSFLSLNTSLLSFFN